MSGYAAKNTGLSGKMSVQDEGFSVTLRFKALTAPGVPVVVSYTTTIDAVESAVKTFTYTNDYTGTDPSFATSMVVESVYFAPSAHSSNFSWEVKANANSQIGGPTALNLFVSRTSQLVYICWVNVNGVWKQALPYVKVAGIWKQAKPYVRWWQTWTISR